MLKGDLRELAIRLIPGFYGEKDILIESISGGGNNKIYLVASDSGKYIFKQYFRHKNDIRNRLKSEFLFTSFAWSHGIRSVAEPIAKDWDMSVGIYKFIKGKKYKTGEIGEKEIEQASAFLKEVNKYKSSPEAISLPTASEACFSIEDHIRLVDYRVNRLKNIVVEDSIDEKAFRFINNNLVVKWIKIKDAVISNANMNNFSLSERILPGDTILSPSDFGFHNAILGDDGLIKFIDFEYAGWDDPAKTVCDFFSQVAVPVSMIYFERFIEAVIGCVYNTEKTLARISLLLPLHRIKWCCIVLNHFMCVDRERKVFATRDAMSKKSEQLDKGVRILDSI